jgi:phospholipid/cholesterol/gamma-HCH transport system substrate-binding protein
VPQDSPFNVRGARNIPCETKPGKRAPTAAMCESDEQYVPLNDGYNWKGDPNATNTGQPIPQLPPGAPVPYHPRCPRLSRRRSRSRSTTRSQVPTSGLTERRTRKRISLAIPTVATRGRTCCYRRKDDDGR